MHAFEFWSAIAVGLVAMGAAYRKVVVPVAKRIPPAARGVRRFFRRAGETQDVILGDPRKGIPSLAQWMATSDARQAATEKWQSEHQVLHVGPGANGAPARTSPAPGGRA